MNTSWKMFLFIQFSMLLLFACNPAPNQETTSPPQDTIPIAETPLPPSVPEIDSVEQVKVPPPVDEVRSFCGLEQYASRQAQADTLQKYYQLAQAAQGTEKAKWEKCFFCAFPSSYPEIVIHSGMNDDYASTTPEYNEVYFFLLGLYFPNLSTIPDAPYYEKYIDICLDGEFIVDVPDLNRGFYNRMLNEPEVVCPILARRSDEEIKGVFYYLFDAMHPQMDYNRQRFKKLNTIVRKTDPRLGNLMQDAFDNILIEKRKSRSELRGQNE